MVHRGSKEWEPMLAELLGQLIKNAAELKVQDIKQRLDATLLLVEKSIKPGENTEVLG
jgi:hypothetical protein